MALTIVLYFEAVAALHRKHRMQQLFRGAEVVQIVIQSTESKVQLVRKENLNATNCCFSVQSHHIISHHMTSLMASDILDIDI